MMKSEIEQILKELSKEFSTKTTALLEARKVFVSFDPEIQLSILQLNQHSDLNVILPNIQSQPERDPLYLTLSNIYWIKVYNQIVIKINHQSDAKTRFYTKYCTHNSKVFGLKMVRKALADLDNLSSNASLVDVLANQVGKRWSHLFEQLKAYL